MFQIVFSPEALPFAHMIEKRDKKLENTPVKTDPVQLVTQKPTVLYHESVKFWYREYT